MIEVGTKQLPGSDFSLNLATMREAQEEDKENAFENANKQNENEMNDSKEEDAEDDASEVLVVDEESDESTVLY